VNCVSPGPVSTDLWLGDHGVAATVAEATAVNYVIDGGLIKTT
jgi:hypothetical protein